MTESPGPPADGRPIPSGVPGLDAILGGGYLQGHVVLVTGTAGSGKTTLGLQFLLEGARRGESALLVSLSDTRREIESVAASHGWSLDGVDLLCLTPSPEDLTPDTQYTLFHPSEVEFGETMKRVVAELEAKRPRRVVIDSLVELRLLSQDHLRFRRKLIALKQLTAASTTIVTDEPQAASAGQDVESLAQSVVRLEQSPTDYGSDRRRLRVVKVRGMGFAEGHHDLRIERGGLVVFPLIRTRTPAEVHETELVSSGLAPLDQLLGAGVERGTSTLLVGPAGTGKSSIASQFVLAATGRGEPAAIFTFEESNSVLLSRTRSLGMDLEHTVRDGLLRIDEVDPADLSPGEFANRLAETVEAHGTRVIVVDSLNGYMNALASDRSLVLHVRDVLWHLSRRSVTSFLVVSQAGVIGSSVSSPVDASFLADNVIGLRFFEAAGEIRKSIAMLKKRTGSHERSIRELQLGSDGIRIGEPLRKFHGILTGLPTFTGKVEALMKAQE